jgi:CHASE1-domain containing sensor protein
MYRSSAQLLFTAASMVAAINGTLGGAGVTLLVRALDLAGLGVAVLAGVAAAVLVFALHLWHQRRRFAQMIDRPANAGTVTASQLHRP